ncbi:MAG: kynureninase [Acidobacteriota bacterium]
MIDVDDLARDPNPLAACYAHFRVAERLLFTGHSHQAWPDRAADGQRRAFDDAAALVDAKWQRAFEQAERVQSGFAGLLGDSGPEIGSAAGSYALAQNTHDLLVRWLSALPLRQRPRLVTTDGEFHSIRRQLQRLEEEGVEVVRVPSACPDVIAERLAAAVDDRTAAVLASTVLFRDAAIVPGLGLACAAARRVGAEMLVDTYHHLNVVPCDLHAEELGEAFVVGGGYKYCQLGEGNCFLRVPPGRDLRPVVTGWFAEFEDLTATAPGRVGYGAGAAAFTGATYDPTSHYRAAAVFDFFTDAGLDVPRLRRISRHQVERLTRGVDALDTDPRLLRRSDRPLDRVGGFLALETPRAEDLHAALAARGVATDFRGDSLRFGPAPYHSDRQIDDALAALGEAVREL